MTEKRKLTPEAALGVLDQIARGAKLSWEDHVLVRDSVKILHDLIIESKTEEAPGAAAQEFLAKRRSLASQKDAPPSKQSKNEIEVSPLSEEEKEPIPE